MLYPGIDNRYASCGRARYDVKQDNNDPEFIARAMGGQKCPNSGRNGYKACGRIFKLVLYRQGDRCTFNVARTVIFPAVQFLKASWYKYHSGSSSQESRTEGDYTFVQLVST